MFEKVITLLVKECSKNQFTPEITGLLCLKLSLYIINSSKQLLITGDLKFNTSGEDSKPLFGLKIYNLRTKEYINLERYPGSLRDYEKFQNEEGNLVVDDSGWQLNIPFYNKERLIELANLFLERSDKAKKTHWKDAYETPIIVIGEKALECKDELIGYKPLSRFSFENLFII